jgi:hypothetical protein
MKFELELSNPYESFVLETNPPRQAAARLWLIMELLGNPQQSAYETIGRHS